MSRKSAHPRTFSFQPRLTAWRPATCVYKVAHPVSVPHTITSDQSCGLTSPDSGPLSVPKRFSLSPRPQTLQLSPILPSPSCLTFAQVLRGWPRPLSTVVFLRPGCASDSMGDFFKMWMSGFHPKYSALSLWLDPGLGSSYKPLRECWHEAKDGIHQERKTVGFGVRYMCVAV